MSIESNEASIETLKMLSFGSPADLTSYLHLRGFIRVLGIRSLAASHQPSYCFKEFATSSEIFLNNGKGAFFHIRFDALGDLVNAGIVKEIL